MQVKLQSRIGQTLVFSAAVFAAQAASAAVRPPDFDGDGFSDLAIGVPLEDIGSAVDAGAVNVIYGSGARLTASGNQFWHQNSAGIIDSAEVGDLFGSALAWGDFDNDGFTDLAIGVPGEDIGGVVDAGAVQIIYGSASGLASAGNQLWYQDRVGVLDVGEAGDDFGYALAAGDFNGDGYTDLAIGVRSEDIGSITNAGAVNVLYGSASGLTSSGDQFWNQNSTNILDTAEAGDNFGFSLAAGDFNGDGFDDLAIGEQDEDIGSVIDAGGVNVIYGSASKLTATNNQFWNQNSSGILDSAETGDNFGFCLAAGDFNGDGKADLAIGIPEESTTTVLKCGAVAVLYGSSARLRSLNNQLWTQDTSGVLDTAEDLDAFGHDLVAGDFNNDGRDELVIGVRDEDINGLSNAGAINVLKGSSAGLTASGNKFLYQGGSGLRGTAAAGENFGDGLAVGDFNGDGRMDLAVAVHDDDVSGVVDAGAVNVIYGSSTVLTSTNNQLWSQNSAGILDACEAGDQVGMGMP